MITLKQIIQDHSQLFSLLQGNINAEITGVQQPELALAQDLCFISNNKQWEAAQKSPCSTWIIYEKFLGSIDKSKCPTQINLLSCKNTQIGMAICLGFFDTKKTTLPFATGISAHALVHPSAILGKNITIAPFSIIGANVEIGDNVIIGPHCTIEGNSKIGAETWLESHVFIANNCFIGTHCHFKPFATIGSEGYGFAPAKDQIIKIPQIGKVIIEDYVQVGANTCIDKATLSETRIGKYTKIDNLVHIAHNCRIGNYCLLTAGFMVAGSTVIEDYCVCGGRVSVADHVHITNNVTLAGASIVTSDISEPGAYGGAPIQTMQNYLKTKSSMTQLPELRKQVSKIIKHLKLDLSQ